jgi:hypothetical protein
VRYPDGAGDGLAILTPALRPSDVEDSDRLIAAESLGEYRGVDNIGTGRLRNCHWLTRVRAYAVLMRNGSGVASCPTLLSALADEQAATAAPRDGTKRTNQFLGEVWVKQRG